MEYVEAEIAAKVDLDNPDRPLLKYEGGFVPFIRERTCKMDVFCMHDEGDFTFRCSECGKGYVEYEPPRYCPHCGAKVMSEEEQGHAIADAIRRLEKAVER